MCSLLSHQPFFQSEVVPVFLAVTGFFTAFFLVFLSLSLSKCIGLRIVIAAFESLVRRLVYRVSDSNDTRRFVDTVADDRRGCHWTSWRVPGYLLGFVDYLAVSLVSNIGRFRLPNCGTFSFTTLRCKEKRLAANSFVGHSPSARDRTRCFFQQPFGRVETQ